MEKLGCWTGLKDFLKECAMLRNVLFDIIRQECQKVESQIAVEQARGTPDGRLLNALRQQAKDLDREIKWFAEAC
jgi:hypothetical protein